MNPLLVGTGCFRDYKYVNEQIKNLVKNYKIDGVMISLATFNELMNFDPSPNSIRFLKNKITTLHAPFKLKKNQFYNNKIYEQIKYVYNIFNCKNVVFHKRDLIDFKFFAKTFSDYNISFENPCRKAAKPGYIKELGRLMKECGAGLTLDVCHALENGVNDLKELLYLYKNKIENYHWSMSIGEKTHYSAARFLKTGRENVKKKVELMLSAVKKTSKPIILEIRYNHVDADPSIIHNEIAWLRNNL